MLWRVRTTLPDRPGALAVLAQECGKAGVNIVGLQVFPDVRSVTDELVLDVPDEWTFAELTELIERADGVEVIGNRCTEAALIDQATRYVEAARAVLAVPASFPEVAAALFDAEVTTASDSSRMELDVGGVQVQIRRDTPFTGTELARGAAMARLVTDVLSATVSTVMPQVSAVDDLTYAVMGRSVSALVGGVVVGRADLGSADPDEPGVLGVDLAVDPAWRRRGIGTRLLDDAARLASSHGAAEIVLTGAADNQAVLPMALSAGLRSRMRVSGGELTVRIGVHDLRSRV